VEEAVFAQNEESTVLLSDAEGASALVARLGRTGSAVCYGSVAELVRQQPLSSVAVLVLHFPPLPKGILLAALGRMTVEYPAMQKVAVLGTVPPLPIAEYLTACGVDMLLADSADEGADRLATVVNRLHERIRWIAT
jgi:hypothetical protein